MIRLGQLVQTNGIQTGPFGSQLHADEYVSTGVGVVMPQDISSFGIDTRSIARISKARADQLERHRLIPGDIVYSRRGDVTRKAFISDSDEDFICGTGCLRVRVDPALADSRCVHYSLGTEETKEWIRRHAVGATMPNLNTSILSSIPLELPTIETQRTVVEILSALDDRIAANRKIARTATELQQQLWNRAEAASPRVSLIKYAEPHLGGTPPRTDDSAWSGDVAWASVKDMSAARDGIITGTAEHISTEASLGARRLNALPAGSTFLSARGTVGCVSTNAIPCAINQSAYAFVPKDGRRTELRLAVESLADELQQRAHGSVFNTITMQTLRESEIPDITSEAFCRESARLEILEQRRVQASLENVKLAATRDELLPLLMSGKITVKDVEKRVEGEV